MTDVVINVDLEQPGDEGRLFNAIESFAKWREPGLDTPSNAPDIMVKTIHGPDTIQKKLIFQDREWAAAFLQYWRSEKLRSI